LRIPRSKSDSVGSSKRRWKYFDKLKDDTRPETKQGIRNSNFSIHLENLLPRITARTADHHE